MRRARATRRGPVASRRGRQVASRPVLHGLRRRASCPGQAADMSSPQWLLLGAAGALVVYAAFVVALIVAGRKPSALAVVRFIPDCIVLVSRLLRDPRVPRRHKLLLGALVGYLALPFDLVPDFIPVAGHLDDVLVVALTLRAVFKGTRGELLREHWPGSQRSLALLAGHA